MRRILLAIGSLALGDAVFAQPPTFFPQQQAPDVILPARIPQAPPAGGEPRILPPSLLPKQTQLPKTFFPSPQTPASPQQTAPDPAQPDVRTEIALPSPEKLQRLDSSGLVVRRMTNSWQLWTGSKLFRDFGAKGEDANDAARAIRELRPTDWATIGSERSIVEYGLTNGKAFLPAFPPKNVSPIELASVRAESVRGVWVLRDDASILLNFGNQKGDAEQAAAVCQRYGFNRLARIGDASSPSLSFFFALSAPIANRAVSPQTARLAGLSGHLQEQSLDRTGIEVPGVGFVGERISIDHRKLEVRRATSADGWAIMHGNVAIAKFGASEWAAKDGLRLLQDLKVTEFCRVNADVSFFLVNGQPPARVPFAVQSYRFEVDNLKLKTADTGGVAVYEANGRKLFAVANTDEGERLIRLLKHYRFDQTCQLGLSTANTLKFLAKTGR